MEFYCFLKCILIRLGISLSTELYCAIHYIKIFQYSITDPNFKHDIVVSLLCKDNRASLAYQDDRDCPEHIQDLKSLQ